MMKVGFYLENQAIADIDFRHPEAGNPGCGGTEFLFASLPYYLKKFAHSRCEPILFANHIELLPATVEAVQVKDCYEAAHKAKAAGCHIFVYRPKRKSEMDMLDLIDRLSLPTLMWIHVIPTSAYIRKIAASSWVKAFICVEHEQHDVLYDTPLRKKLTYIVNGFDVDGFRAGLNKVDRDPNLVVHVGTLVPQKNFHLIAQAWPKIVAQHPSAHLMVIGSGFVYGSGTAPGPWGIAEDQYERQVIMPYLADQTGRPIPSVTFKGRMGAEKREWIARATVGIPNPTGDNENCPGTNIEMSALGVPVVSGQRYGSLDTVCHGVTGLLGNSLDDLVRHVVYLLKHPDQAWSKGQAGIDFIRKRYDYQSVVMEWCNLFDRIEAGHFPVQKGFKSNIFKHQKIIRVINRFFQDWIGSIFLWPSLNEVKEKRVQIRSFRLGRKARL